VGEEEAFVVWRVWANFDFRFILPQPVAQQTTLTKGQQWRKRDICLQKIKQPFKLFFLWAVFLETDAAFSPLLREVFFLRLGIFLNIFSLVSVFLVSFLLPKKLKFQKNISKNPKVQKKNFPTPPAFRVSPFVRSLRSICAFAV